MPELTAPELTPEPVLDVELELLESSSLVVVTDVVPELVLVDVVFEFA